MGFLNSDTLVTLTSSLNDPFADLEQQLDELGIPDTAAVSSSTASAGDGDGISNLSSGSGGGGGGEAATPKPFPSNSNISSRSDSHTYKIILQRAIALSKHFTVQATGSN